MDNHATCVRCLAPPALCARQVARHPAAPGRVHSVAPDRSDVSPYTSRPCPCEHESKGASPERAYGAPLDFTRLQSHAMPLQQLYDMAICDFSEILECRPDDIHARFSRGMALFKSAQIERAHADFSRVLELNPHHVMARYARYVERLVGLTPAFDEVALVETNAWLTHARTGRLRTQRWVLQHRGRVPRSDPRVHHCARARREGEREWTPHGQVPPPQRVERHCCCCLHEARAAAPAVCTTCAGQHTPLGTVSPTRDCATRTSANDATIERLESDHVRTSTRWIAKQTQQRQRRHQPKPAPPQLDASTTTTVFQHGFNYCDGTATCARASSRCPSARELE